MRFGGLRVLSKPSGKGVFDLASWHSPHSLTWSWILSLRWQVPGYVTPHVQWSSIGPLRFRGLSVGSLINVHAILDNNGWQWGATLLGIGVEWKRQPPMWYRDLYQDERRRQFERKFA